MGDLVLHTYMEVEMILFHLCQVMSRKCVIVASTKEIVRMFFIQTFKNYLYKCVQVVLFKWQTLGILHMAKMGL